jgi:hypothetical protein
VVARVNDKLLTTEVLTSLLEQHLNFGMHFQTLQLAINQLGDQAFTMIIERARRADVTDDQMSGLADLVGALDPTCLTPGLALGVALDENFDDGVRLTAFCLTPIPLDERALPLICRALRSEDFRSRWAAMKALARVENPLETVIALYKDESFTIKERVEIASNVRTIFPDLVLRQSFIRRCISDNALPARIVDVNLTLSARYSDRYSFDLLLAKLPTSELDVACATISLFGHYPIRQLGVDAARLISGRVKTAAEACAFSRAASTGMTTVFEMDNFRSGGLKPTPLHPATDVWMALVDEWRGISNATEIEHIRILTSASELGSVSAVNELERILKLLEPDDKKYDAEDDYGHSIRSAIDQLRRNRRLLPLNVCVRFVRASRPNVPYAGIEAISAYADRAALELLIQLHNDGVTRTASETSDAIESLSARLGLKIEQKNDGLKISMN